TTGRQVRSLDFSPSLESSHRIFVGSEREATTKNPVVAMLMATMKCNAMWNPKGQSDAAGMLSPSVSSTNNSSFAKAPCCGRSLIHVVLSVHFFSGLGRIEL